MAEWTRDQLVEQILRRRVSAIIRTEDRQLAAAAMDAAVDGGFEIVEFTLTTPGALALLGRFRANSESAIKWDTKLAEYSRKIFIDIFVSEYFV